MEANYYLIGSKYEEGKGNWINMFPEMLERGVVSVGWEREYSLKRYYGKSRKQIFKYWEDNQLNPDSFHVFKHFLNLKPGDLIAIKSNGSPKGGKPYLSIVGYAVVVEKTGEIYHHARSKIGHMINVDYIGDPVFIELTLGGYGSTIHLLKNREHIEQIFSGMDIGALNLSDSDDDEEETQLDTSSQLRSGSKSYVANAAHNILQQKFYTHLSQIYGKKKVKLEKEDIDITLTNEDEITIYEVKPYHLVTQCIRQAMGQLLQYSYRTYRPGILVNLAIVGPVDPDENDIEFLEYIRHALRIPLEYISFNLGEAKEY
jgi:hypothetical protein